jgi:large subunit ribosomal protein L10Ae
MHLLLLLIISSKVSSDFLKSTITTMLAERKKREFTETIELQIGLRDYNPDKDKRFTGSIKLPNMPYPNKKIAIIGTMKHCEEAKAAGVACIDTEGLKKFNKEAKLIKKWAKPYDTLICSESLMK